METFIVTLVPAWTSATGVSSKFSNLELYCLTVTPQQRSEAVTVKIIMKNIFIVANEKKLVQKFLHHHVWTPVKFIPVNIIRLCYILHCFLQLMRGGTCTHPTLLVGLLQLPSNMMA